jgi:uncharacterized protein DUF4253
VGRRFGALATITAMDDLRRTLSREGIDTTHLELLVELPDLTIPVLPIRRGESFALWMRMRALLPRTGVWPVLFSEDDAEERDRLVEDSFEDVTGRAWVENAIERSRTVEVTGWLASKLSTHQEKYGGLPRGDWPTVALRSRPAGEFPPRADKPEDDEFWACSGVRVRSDGQVHHVLMAFVPVLESWQVAPAMAFGGWNDNPFAFEHAAVHRYWLERFGAEVVALNTPTVELWVARPPTDQDSAIELALEQFAYCEDIVGQGYQTIERFAAILIGSHVWSFWWD